MVGFRTLYNNIYRENDKGKYGNKEQKGVTNMRRKAVDLGIWESKKVSVKEGVNNCVKYGWEINGNLSQNWRD